MALLIYHLAPTLKAEKLWQYETKFRRKNIWKWQLLTRINHFEFNLNFSKEIITTYKHLYIIKMNKYKK